MAAQWQVALGDFRQALALAAAEGMPGAMEDLAIAESCQIHFQSTANQLEFYILRDGESTAEAKARMRELARQEIELAVRLYPLAKRHSVIAYEASQSLLLQTHRSTGEDRQLRQAARIRTPRRMPMPEDPQVSADQPVEPAPPETPESKQDEQDAGDFITRHVLEKDSVFFEG
jgi:hypothetical protein